MEHIKVAPQGSADMHAGCKPPATIPTTCSPKPLGNHVALQPDKGNWTCACADCLANPKQNNAYEKLGDIVAHVLSFFMCS